MSGKRIVVALVVVIVVVGGAVAYVARQVVDARKAAGVVVPSAPGSSVPASSLTEPQAAGRTTSGRTP